MWGVAETDLSNVGRFDPSSLGDAVFDSKFDASSFSAQIHLEELCRKVSNSDILANVTSPASCFILGYKDYIVNTTNQSFPAIFDGDTEIQSTLFKESLLNYTQAIDGASDQVVFEGDRLRFVKFAFKADIVVNAPYVTADPFYARFEEIMDESNADAPEGVNNGFQTTFQWPKNEGEALLVRGLIVGLAISASVAFVVLVRPPEYWFSALI